MKKCIIFCPQGLGDWVMVNPIVRIYEDDNYTDGNWKDRVTLGGKNINFVFDIFKNTHVIQKDLRHQGYVIVEPNHFLL